MFIAPRLRKIREIRGWKQASVAAAMHTTQQSYSSLEQGTGYPKIDTLKRFCDVMNVQLHYLMAVDVPITEESLEKYGSKDFAELISDCAKLEQKLEVFSSILMTNDRSAAFQNTLRARIIAA
jgi:transcriptional regulator with XRE-family HTH domain